MNLYTFSAVKHPASTTDNLHYRNLEIAILVSIVTIYNIYMITSVRCVVDGITNSPPHSPTGGASGGMFGGPGGINSRRGTVTSVVSSVSCEI